MGVAHKEIGKRLYALDKYELASFGWFYHSAQQRNIDWDLPWRQYTTNNYQQPYGHPANWPNSSPDDWRDCGPYQIIDKFKPDVVIAIGDMWMCDYLYELPNRDSFKLIHEIPIDGEPIPRDWVNKLKSSDAPVVMSHYGREVIGRVDKYAKVELIHRGLDVQRFRKLAYDKDVLREKLMKGSEGKFVVGIFDRFQDRKQVQRAIEAFAKFSKDKREHCDLYLHLDINDPFSMQAHKALVGDNGIIERYGLEENIVINSKVTVEKGVDLKTLVLLYNACDVKISASQGEGWGLCVAPDTKIQTNNGVKEIKDIVVGDSVLTETGEFHNVLATTSRDVESIYEVKVSGLEEIRVTEEHPFLTLNNDNLTWRNIKNISVGDFVATPKMKPVDVCATFIDLSVLDDRLEYDDDFVWYKTGYNQDGVLKKYKRFIYFDDDFFYVSGWYLAEGTTYKNQISLYCGDQDNEYILKCQKWFESIGCTTRLERKDKNLNLYIPSTIISKLFETFYSRLSGSKRISHELFERKYNFLPLLDAYIKGDGYIQKNDISITTKSPHLAYQIKQILSSENIFAKIFYDKVRDFSYRVIVSGKYAKLLNDKLGWDVQFTERLGSSTKDNGDFFLSPIRHIERKSFRDKVYDISVEHVHSFVGNGVLLHNTNVEAMACGLPVIGTNYTTFPELLKDGRGLLADVKTYVTGMYNVERALVDTEHMSQLLEMLYRSPDLRKKLGENARTFVQQFDWNKIILQWEKLIDSLVKTPDYILADKPRSFYLDSKEVNIEGAVRENTGWAITTRGFTEGLEKCGWNVNITEGGGSNLEFAIGKKIKEALMKPKSNSLDLINHMPQYAFEILSKSRAKHKALYFPWEMDKMNWKMVREINRNSDVYMCPTQFTKDIADRNGVRNTALVPLASNLKPETGNKIEQEKGYSFLVMGNLGDIRKNIHRLIKAYNNTFKSTDDVSLILKTMPGHANSDPTAFIEFERLAVRDFPQIKVIHEDDPHLEHYYATADCLIQPSYSEGWGHPVFEALKFGMPIIAPKYGGYLDFVNRGENVQLIDYVMVSAWNSPLFTGKEQWASFDFDDMCSAMKKAYGMKMRKTGIDYVQDYTWENTGKALIEGFNKISKKDKTKIFYNRPQKNLWNADNEEGFKTYAPPTVDFVDSVADADIQIIDFTRLSDQDYIKSDRYILFMHCFTDKVKIQTDLGIKSIADAELGDKIVNENGEFSEVQQLHKRKYSGELLKIARAGDFRDIEVTPEHPILVRKVDRTISGGIQNVSDKSWCEAKDINIGDRLMYPRIKEQIDCPYSDDEMNLFGWYLAEGHCSEYSVNWTLSLNEKPIAEKLVATLESIGVTSKYKVYGNCVRVVANSKHFSEKIKFLFSTGSHSKRIPVEFLKYNNRSLEILIRAYISGDGCIFDNKSVHVHSVSLNLIEAIRTILIKLGFPPSLRVQEREKTNYENATDIYSLHLYGRHALHYLGIEEEYKNNGSGQQIYIDEDYAYYRVCKISQEHYEGSVYNLGMSPSRTYTVNGVVVHNCFGEWSEENPVLYRDVFEKAEVVYSHLDLKSFFPDLEHKFIRGPWGVNPDKWMKDKSIANDEYQILNTGEIPETEGIKECIVACDKLNERMLHVGTPQKFNNASYNNTYKLTDEQMRDSYNRSRWVSALRRFEGFEKPAMEGLLCGCRPICFDTPLYRYWYGDLARYVKESTEKETSDDILRVFKEEYSPVTADEMQTALDRFGWRNVSITFWNEIQTRGLINV